MQVLIVLGSIFLSTISAAADVSFRCPQAETKPELSLIYAQDSLRVTDDKTTVSLVASLLGDPAGILTVVGSGPAKAVMPNTVAFDECLVASLKEHGATAADADMLAYSVNACQLELTLSGTTQDVQLQLTLTSIDKGKATLFIQQQYLSPSAVAGMPLWLDEFPVRNCDVVLGQ